MIIWPTAADPAEGTWLECNGQSAAAYPALAAIVGSSVPDYRGYFLRGVGGNSAALNTEQGDTIRNITGTVGTVIGFAAGANTGAFRSGAYYLSISPQGDGRDGSIVSFDSSRVVPTANENRPINKSVRYLIRAA